ncbi:MAG: TIGR04283 family arsenosugar biosynthesis glycosyltransferase [Gemmataceae bacterium]|nr:TIGR04283 family arsenosugar biosynthesis glycosyltransferase [Gemmataceae bacterium]
MSVSIIIPTLNEASCIAATIANLREQRPLEIIVIDGGSADGTVDLARGADRILSVPPARAAQMNAGADAARGRTLLFWHADCTLADDGLDALAAAMRRPSVVAGCFSMRVAAEGFLYRTIDACATARVRLTGIVYGDQGLFVRRDDFIQIGGFPPVRFMEDVLISQRLRRRGRVVVLPQRIVVSPRRWQKAGLVRQTLRNWTLTALALAGTHPDRLASHYPAVR